MNRLLLLFIFMCLPLALFSQKPDDLVTAIDKKIAELKKEIHNEQLVEMHEEVDGQGLMIADWQAYGKEVMKIKKNEMKTSRLQKKIDELEQRKQALLQQRQLKSSQ